MTGKIVMHAVFVFPSAKAYGACYPKANFLLT
jgi:hypothetical protein